MTEEEKKEALKAYNMSIAVGDQCRTAGIQLVKGAGSLIILPMLAHIDAMRELSDNPIERAAGCMALIGLGQCVRGAVAEILE